MVSDDCNQSYALAFVVSVSEVECWNGSRSWDGCVAREYLGGI